MVSPQEINNANHRQPLPCSLWLRDALWQTVIKLDKGKINLVMAVRNSLGVAIPLAIGIALGHPLGGVAVASGALNVAYSDGRDPYPLRARRMLAWTLLGGFAVFLGSVTGRNSVLAVILATVWAFMAGLALSVSQRAGDLGLNTLVTIVVFAARGAMPLRGAITAGLLVILGGIIQMALALLFWPLRRYEPERLAVGDAYCKLADELNPEHAASPDAILKAPSQEVQDVLASLGRDQSTEGYRLRLLFDQVDRLRISTFALEAARSRLLSQQGAGQTLTAIVNAVLRTSSRLVASIGDHLRANRDLADVETLVGDLQAALDVVYGPKFDRSLPVVREVSSAVDVLAGQLRSVVTLATNATTDGAVIFARNESAYPWRLQVRSWIGSLRANLDLRSAYFRHALRLAVCVGLGDTISRYIEWQRTYWLPMTIAVVLKPDFTTTISRGVLRLAGTFGGLIVATVLYHAFPPSAMTQLILVGAFTLMLRSLGPANYGVFSIAISGLIVFLIAETGVPPSTVITERALNTAAGGCFALAAYALWPTWERTQVNEEIAQMLDAARAYFRGTIKRFGESSVEASTLDALRSAWRRARADVEASVNRIAAEPGVDPGKLSCLTSIEASSQVVVRCIMSLESALIEGRTEVLQGPFRQFTNDIDFTIYYLAAALRGSRPAFETLPNLREDHRGVLEARDQLPVGDEVIIETADQLTVALNTLREQVIRYCDPALRC